MSNGWRPGPLPLEPADVPALLAEHPVVVIYFWAPWNGVDRQFSPVLDTIRPEFEGRITFRSADVDDERLAEFCKECGVVNVPALGCFIGGQRVKTIVGARPADVVRAELAPLLGEVVSPNPALPQPPRGVLGWLRSLARLHR